jgi:hypothetical protein
MAAPHIAGATALIKQLHPAWSPEMIKANLMNTARDLGLNVYTQGAGRVQVDAAARAQAILTPGSVGFGVVDVDQPLWTKTETLQLTNVTTTSVNCSLQVSGTLPTGVTTSLDPASVTLGAGESVTVTFGITVDNTIFPYQVMEPGSYEGRISVESVAQAGIQSMTDSLLAPFAFFKRPVLEITSYELPMYLAVHDRQGNIWDRLPSRTKTVFFSTFGTYDVWAMYRDGHDTAAWVVCEGVELRETSGIVRLNLSRNDAAHTVTFAPRDELGRSIPTTRVKVARRLVHVPTGLFYDNTVNIVGGVWEAPPTHISELSTDYAFQWRLDVANDQVFYEFNDQVSGLSSDIVFENDPSDLQHLGYQCHPGPNKGPLKFVGYVPYG